MDEIKLRTALCYIDPKAKPKEWLTEFLGSLAVFKQKHGDPATTVFHIAGGLPEGIELPDLTYNTFSFLPKGHYVLCINPDDFTGGDPTPIASAN